MAKEGGCGETPYDFRSMTHEGIHCQVGSFLGLDKRSCQQIFLINLILKKPRVRLGALACVRKRDIESREQ